MKKKKIIFVVIACFLLFEAFCLVGYILLNKRIERREYEYYCEEIQIDLQGSESFENQYGEVVSVTFDEAKKYEILSDSKRLIPCIVQTERNKFYFVWVEFDIVDLSSNVKYDEIIEIIEKEE